jgi:hypothetical protein
MPRQVIEVLHTVQAGINPPPPFRFVVVADHNPGTEEAADLPQGMVQRILLRVGAEALAENRAVGSGVNRS